jgi:subtilisin family serine protease
MIRSHTVVLACVAFCIAWAFHHGPSARAQDGPSAVDARAGEDVRGAMGPAGFTLAQLYHAYAQHRASGLSPKAFQPSTPALAVREGAVNVEVIAQPTEEGKLEAALRARGMTQVIRQERLVTGWLPIEAIPDAARLDAVHSLYPVLTTTHVGSVTSRGVIIMETDALRSNLGTDGSGVTVGVMSNSLDFYDGSAARDITFSDDVASGDLPPIDRIQVLEEAPGAANDEGRAMMQIVHDVAPGADLAYHTALGGRGAFANGIRALADAGASVIVDDLLYLNEPVFQDGIIAQAIDDVARQQEVVHVSAAGNSGTDGYQAPFTASGETGPFGGELHDFDPGPGVDTQQRVNIDPGSQLQIAVHWDQPYASTGGPGAETDLEVYLVDQEGRLISQLQPEQRDNRLGDPFEFITFNEVTVDANRDSEPDSLFNIVIERIAGPAPTRVRYVPFLQQGGFEVEEYDQEVQTLYGHPNAASAIAVGAVAWFLTPRANPDLDRPLVQSFSSVGGTPILFDQTGRPTAPIVRPKPDLVGPDGTNTTFFGQDLNDGDAFPNFFGTSAAAPHVAGLAALIRAAAPDLTPTDVRDALAASADDIQETDAERSTTFGGEDAAGFDFFSGAGLVKGDAVTLLSPVVTSFLATLDPSTMRTVRVSWTERSGAGIATYQVERSVSGGPFEAAAEPVASTGASDYEISVPDLQPGRQSLRLRWTTDGGDTVVGPTTQVIVPVGGAFEITRRPYPNPTRSEFRFEIAAREEQGVVAALYDLLGRRTAILYRGRLLPGQPATIRASNLESVASGRYFVRIVGETFETAVPVTIAK